MPRFVLPFLLALVCAVPVQAQERPVHIAPNAPADRPVRAAMPCQWYAAERAMEPYVREARESYPAARARFQQGLPAGHSFFVTTRLRDSLGRIEQVFIAVDSIADGTIRGRVWSQIRLVQGYRLRQPYEFAEPELIDWMVARPDGTEEGNVVGVFMDTYRPPTKCSLRERAG